MSEQYIINAKDYLPEFLQESEIMLSVVDCLNVLLSKDTPFFAQIFEAYTDSIYKTRNYFKLSTQAKIAIIEELGFDYLLDIVPLTDDQLSQLLIFFNLVYMLKGRREGLEICLRALGIKQFTYTTWDKQSPMGPAFTALLTIVGTNYTREDVFAKLKNFVRCYMLPWIDIVIVLEVEGAPLYIYPSAGILMREKHYIEIPAIRDILEGIAPIATGPNQVTPKYKGSVQVGFYMSKEFNLKINDKVYSYPIPNYTKTSNIQVERFVSNDTIMVGITGTGDIYSNTNGNSWIKNSKTIEDPILLKCVNKRFFIFGEDTTLTSMDGKNWTELTLSFKHTLQDESEVTLTGHGRDIIYDGKYIMVCDNGIGFESQDGTTWTGFLIEPYYEDQIQIIETPLYGWDNDGLVTELNTDGIYTKQVSTYTGTTLTLYKYNQTSNEYEDTELVVEVKTEETEEGLQPQYVVTSGELEYILTRNTEKDFTHTKTNTIPAQTRKNYNFNRICKLNNSITVISYIEDPILYISYDGETWSSRTSTLQASEDYSDYYNSGMVALDGHLIISMKGLGLYHYYNNAWTQQGSYLSQLRFIDNKLQGFNSDYLCYISVMNYGGYMDSYLYINNVDVGLPQEAEVTDMCFFKDYYRVKLDSTTKDYYNLIPVREQILFINEDDGQPYYITKTVNIGEYITYEMYKEGYQSYINICAPLTSETITLPNSLQPKEQ